MKRNKRKNKAYSLPEVTIALLILTLATLPLIGTISSDTKNTVVVANSEFAMQKARYILDTMLDSVAFDDLKQGDPAKISGTSLTKYYSQMFPESAGSGICQGYITDDKGQKFLVSVKVVNIPNVKYSCFEIEDRKKERYFYSNDYITLNHIKSSETSEKAGKQSNAEDNGPGSIYSKPIYKDAPEISYTDNNFYKGKNQPDCLLKSIILNIKWNDKNKKQPATNGYREFNLITNKARLL